MNKIFLAMLFAIMLVGVASAAEQSLGTFKQGDCVNLVQICSNCTFNNITSLLYPNSSSTLKDVIMTKSGTEYNYTFCSASIIGTYVVNGLGDLDGEDTVWSYTFDITPSGFIDTLGLYCVILAIIAGLVILGFAIKDGWFVVFGGMASIALGLYSINYGIVGFRDSMLTLGTSFFLVGIGAYLAINSAIEMIGGE